MKDALFLSAGGYHHHLGFNTWESKGGNPPPPGTTGLYHVAIKYPTRAALGDAFRRLVAADWPLDGFNDHGTHEALYLRDPDGNGLEFAWDRPADQWPRDQQAPLTFGNRPRGWPGAVEWRAAPRGPVKSAIRRADPFARAIHLDAGRMLVLHLGRLRLLHSRSSRSS